MVGVELDEAIGRGDGRSALVVLPVGVGDLELGLLGIAAVRIARLELLEQLDRLLPVARRHRVLRLAVEALRRPAQRLVLALERAAAGSDERSRGKERSK